MNILVKNIKSYFEKKQQKNKIKKRNKRAEEMSFYISVINKEIFKKSIIVDTCIDDYDNQNKNSVASYNDEEDRYEVNASAFDEDYSQLEFVLIASHEVRHRIQKKFPDFLLDEDFLLKNNLTDEIFINTIKAVYLNSFKDKVKYIITTENRQDKEFIDKIRKKIEEYKENNIPREIDAYFIEEEIRKKYLNKKSISMYDIIDISKLLLSNKTNFLQKFNN